MGKQRVRVKYGPTLLLTDADLSAKVPEPLFKTQRADLVRQVAVGMSIARHPPHRPVRALLTHTVLTLDIWRRSAQWDMGGAHESQEASGPDAS